MQNAYPVYVFCPYLLHNNLVLDSTGLKAETVEADVVAVRVGLLEVFEDSLSLVDQHAQAAVVVLVLLVVLDVAVQVLNPDSHNSGCHGEEKVMQRDRIRKCAL